MSMDSSRINELELKVADLDTRRRTWRWAPDNPLTKVESEIFEVLDEIMEIYPNASTEQREYLRKMLDRYGAVGQYLKAYVTGNTTRLDTTVSPERLYPALLAVSIDNSNFGDYRDVLVMLGNLWLTAARAGIDPKPHFERVAAISSATVHKQGNKSTQEILATFDASAYFQEAVQPYLSQD